MTSLPPEEQAALAKFFVAVMSLEDKDPRVLKIARNCGLLDDEGDATRLARVIYANANAWALGYADSAAFMAMLENPPEPNEVLRDAAERFRSKKP